MVEKKLSAGERLSNTLIDEAKEEGYSRDTLFRAKTKAGIKAAKTGFGKESQWWWRLPEEGNQ